MSARPALTLRLLPATFAVCRLPPEAPDPEWAKGEFVSITRTRQEVSVVCEEKNVPEGVARQGDFACLVVAGPLDFALTGVMASLAGPLADAGISIFPLGTYDTDYVFVRRSETRRAIAALEEVGHRIM
jgi:hypothetical protein